MSNCDGSDSSRLFNKSDYLYDFDNVDCIAIGKYLWNFIGWLNLVRSHQQLMFGMCTLSTLPPFFQHMFHVNMFLVHVKAKYQVFRKLQAKQLRAWPRYISNRDNSFKAVYFEPWSDLRCSIFNRRRRIDNKIINTRNVGAFYKHVNRKLL